MLAQRIGLVARNRGVRKLQVTTQATNVRMLCILRKLGAELRRAGDQVEGEIALAPATGASLAEDWAAAGLALAAPVEARRSLRP